MSREELEKAVSVLRNGGVVCFPTDTVWGVGALISSEKGLKRLYEIKGREGSKPTAVLVADEEMAGRYGELSEKAGELINRFWPGGLTLVVRSKKGMMPGRIVGEGGKVGLRAPDHELVRELIYKLGEGLVATSANVSGGKAPLVRDEVDSRLVEEVDMVVEGVAGGRMASTVVEVLEKELKVIRRGDVRVN